MSVSPDEVALPPPDVPGPWLAKAIGAQQRMDNVIDSVATTGVCEVFPGAVNSIPSRVRLGVDVRDIDEKRRDGMLAAAGGPVLLLANPPGRR